MPDNQAAFRLFEQGVTAQTPLQPAQVRPLNGHCGNHFPQLLNRIISRQTKNTGLATPAAVAREQQIPLIAIGIQLLLMLQVCVERIKAQDPQPFCQFPQHAVRYKALFHWHHS
jgi:hypothetical protein